MDAAMFDRIPFNLLTNVPNNAVSVTALRQAGPIIMSVSKDGPMAISKLSCQRSGTAKVELILQDGSGPGIPLMNSPCHIDAILGSGQKPYILPQPLFLDENHVLNAFFSDLSGETNTIRINAGGARFLKDLQDPDGKLARERMLRRQYVSMPYFYTTYNGPVVLAAPAASAGNGIFEIAANAWFEIHQISYVATSPLFNIDLYNQATGESLINAPGGQHYKIPARLMLGDNNFPFKLHEPWMIGPGQKLIAEMTNDSGAENTVHLVLGGIWYRTGDLR